MLQDIENGGAIILITIICSLASLLWPILVSYKSRLHVLGIVLHSICQLVLLILIINSIEDISLNSTINILAVNDFTLTLKVSKIGILFAILITLLWPAAYIYSIGYLVSQKDKAIPRFLLFLNLSVFFAIVLSFAGDLLTMFILYECLTLATLPLVAHNYSVHLNKALKKYIIYLFFGSLCLWLPSILYIKSTTTSLEFLLGGHAELVSITKLYGLPILLFTILGISKAAIFPMHGWLPSAMAANYPTSGLLHGVLVVNTGIYCLYKVVFEIFGHQIVNDIVRNNFINYILLFGVFYSGLMAIFQSTVKKILAWSTVSQMNLIFLISLSSNSSFFILSVIGLLYHSFYKITLFFCAGYIYSANYATKLQEFRNSFYKFKLEFAIFSIISLMLIGLPILGFGAYKTYILKKASFYQEEVLIIAIIVSFVFSLIYLGKIILEMSAKDEQILSLEEIRNKPNIYMRLSILYCGIVSIILSVYFSEIIFYIQNILVKN